MSEKVKDIVTRSAKTFWQAALASLAITIPQIVETLQNGWNWEIIKPLLISAGVGALAAGFSAAYNGALKPIIDKLKANTTSAEK